MKRGPYDCAHVTADRKVYDANYYATNREKILARRRMRRVLNRRKLRKEGVHVNN